METGKDWVEGLPFLMFAIRESVQESLGFSPSELVFGHTVRGPLKLLSEQLLDQSSKPVPVDDYVTSNRERLHKAQILAKLNLSTAQTKMKKHFDKRSVKRDFHLGDPVLVLLPIPVSISQAKFSGPYLIERKLNETNFLVATPDRKCKTCVCHVNRLKTYVDRAHYEVTADQTECSPLPASIATVGVVANYSMEEDGLMNSAVPVSSTRLKNSAILQNLPHFLSHLTDEHSKDLTKLLYAFPTLFSDVPCRTSVCSKHWCWWCYPHKTIILTELTHGNEASCRQKLSICCIMESLRPARVLGALPAYLFQSLIIPSVLHWLSEGQQCNKTWLFPPS